jgi:uncharacterized protein YbjT (DUF2867 family)
MAAAVRRGATMSVGAQDDLGYMVRATEDVDALFWVTPPGYGSDNVRAFQNRMARAAVAAIRTNEIPRVVNLSSIGADQDSGVGPIGGLHDVESQLNDAGDNITHLRPGSFYENLLRQVDIIKNEGKISLPISGSRHLPMIAARDVARVAADRLANRDWTGQSIRELHGPDDLSLDEVAKVLSKALGRSIEYVRCDREQARHALLQSAISENSADLILEMYEAIETGRIRLLKPRSPETTTPTTLAEFARLVMQPRLAESITH